MNILGRRVLITTLDPIPRNFRAAPGVIAMNNSEIKALQNNDGEKFKELAEIIQAEDAADAMLQMRKLPKRQNKLGPSIRLSMLNAIHRKAGSLWVVLSVPEIKI